MRRSTPPVGAGVGLPVSCCPAPPKGVPHVASTTRNRRSVPPSDPPHRHGRHDRGGLPRGRTRRGCPRHPTRRRPPLRCQAVRRQTREQTRPGRLRPVRGPTPRQPLPRQHAPHLRLSALRGCRPAPAHLPPDRRPAVLGRALRRLGGTRHPVTRPHHRPSAQRPGPGAREHRGPRVRRQGPGPGLGARRVPAGRPGGRLHHRLPLRVPRVGIRPVGGGRQTLGSVLHAAQDHGRAAGPVPAERRPRSPGGSAGDGRVGRRPHRAPVVRAHAEPAEGGVRRHERRAGPAVPGDG